MKVSNAVLAQKIDDTKKTLDALFCKFDKLVDPKDGTIVTLNIKTERNTTKLNIISWALGVVFVAIAGVVVKLFLGA